MKALFAFLSFATAGGFAHAAGNPMALPAPVVPSVATPPRPPAAPTEPSRWNFSLIPRSFQKSPNLDITIITEMTEFGRKQPPVLPEAPAYFVAQSGGHHTMGQRTVENTLSTAEVEMILLRALSANGYLPATPAHPPALVVIYSWGAHNAYATDNIDSSDGTSIGNVADENQVLRNILDRAALAGGAKYAADLGKAIKQANMIYQAIDTRLGRGSLYATDSENSMNLGAAQSMMVMSVAFDPVHLFKQRSLKNEFIFDQAMGNCYYVVASAYDYQSLAHPPQRLLWRTRMTVSTQGVSQYDSLPTLIASAAPYFGRDMAESEIMTKPVHREGHVEVGTPTVVESPAIKPTEIKPGKM